MNKSAYIIIFSFLFICCKADKYDHETSKPNLAKLPSHVNIYVAAQGLASRPHYYWNYGEKEPMGIEPELIKAILNKLDIDYTFIDKSYGGADDPRIDAVVDGIADLSIRGITINDDRKKKVLFSDPYYIDGLGIMVKSNSKAQNIKDLEGKKILAVEYTTAYDWLKQNAPNSILLTEKDVSPDLRVEELILNEEIDAYMVDYSFLKEEERQSSPSVRVLNKKFNEEPLGIAISKEIPNLKKEINKTLKKMSKSGELQKLTSRYED